MREYIIRFTHDDFDDRQEMHSTPFPNLLLVVIVLLLLLFMYYYY